jgi:hypothetical protein
MTNLKLLALRLLPVAFALSGCATFGASRSAAPPACTDPARPQTCSAEVAWAQTAFAAGRP